MRQRCQQRVANTFALACQPRLLFAGGERQPFKGAGDQQGEGFKQALLLGDHQLTQVRRLDDDQPVIFIRAAQRQDLVRHAGQRVGAGTGR